ncbi:MAG: hypothetical protein HYW27_01340 [Candidatus Aenigmarchaeota archaeon]|nr:hypothetical protein [Candidatus Aenigmarchaeota archaeon]
MKVRSNMCPCGGYHAPWRCPKITLPPVEMKENFSGPSSGIFVGRLGYPNVFAGPLGMLGSGLADSPGSWFGMRYSDIIAMRFSVIRSKDRQSVRSREKLVSDMQELSLAKAPTDVEMLFRKKPSRKMTFSPVSQPMGPSAELKRLTITENPKINAKVERIAGDDLKAAQASSMLYGEGIDVYQITNILSSGALGTDKKMVPTRWSITGTDDMLAKGMMKEIRQFRPISDCMVFSSAFLHNQFEILLMPGSWEYENFESSPDTGLIVEEYEPFHGRKAYAEKEGGGYYAARFAVCEALHRMRRQARVVVFREIGSGYSVPLGVWQVRENVRNAMRQKTARFSTRNEALDYIGRRLRIPIHEYMRRSAVLQQRSLTDF